MEDIMNNIIKKTEKEQQDLVNAVISSMIDELGTDKASKLISESQLMRNSILFNVQENMYVMWLKTLLEREFELYQKNKNKKES